MYEDDQCDFVLKCLRDEIAAQANTFDQIDNKTGVALGFTFVAVGQVLASVFRMATDQNHFRTLHPHAVGWIFALANVCVVAAIIFGVVARWPRSFVHSMEWPERNYGTSINEMKNHACDALLDITKTNDKTNIDKGAWARATYLSVAMALLFYLMLTILLYVYSIPK
jgi:hypothetical protein